MDRIIGRGLRFYGCHGVLEEEQHNPQPFEVDFELWLDLAAAGQRDDLGQTVDYGQVFQVIRQVVEEEHYKLLEALAERLAGVLLEQFAAIQEVDITVYKPQAPVAGDFKYFAVKIHRARL
ncbi:MAG TPA: dihydroneopterin aldolase [Syntrophomonadaceae bacterium]|nr:dihydroneopterin aldolase [Syntrophomonadaceae bacterium]HOQ10183.1 dihydroneopterin aldolase [Syntrophomonadaceae bacterium]HPU49772.1 dihydroneopterin aldolase [Syntrophomonadaceae bacterium]